MIRNGGWNLHRLKSRWLHCDCVSVKLGQYCWIHIDKPAKSTQMWWQITSYLYWNNIKGVVFMWHAAHVHTASYSQLHRLKQLRCQLFQWSSVEKKSVSTWRSQQVQFGWCLGTFIWTADNRKFRHPKNSEDGRSHTSWRSLTINDLIENQWLKFLISC